MGQTLEEQSKELYNIVNNSFLSKSYMAQQLYKDKTAKQATSMFHQKLKGITAMNEEDVFKLYEIVTNEVQSTFKDLEVLANKMSERYVEYDRNRFMKEKMKEMSPEMFDMFKKAVEAELKKEK